MLRRGKRLALVGVVLVVACGAVGIAYAVIPNTGVISACDGNSSGALRVIDATSTNCKNNETLLAWNEQGLKGDKGDKGDQGIQGIQGPPGLSGRVVVTANYSSSNHAAIAACPTGKVVLGGGFNGPGVTFSGPSEALGVPDSDYSGWIVLGTDTSITAYAICATVAAAG
jgi:hypothetical protein